MSIREQELIGPSVIGEVLAFLGSVHVGPGYPLNLGCVGLFYRPQPDLIHCKESKTNIISIGISNVNIKIYLLSKKKDQT